VTETDDLYELLGVEPDASRDEIRGAYRDRVAELDKALARPKVRDRQALRAEKGSVNRAWAVLADAYQRERYDAARTGANGSDVDDEEDGEPTGDRRSRRPARDVERRGRADPGPDAAPIMKRLGAAMMDVIVMAAFVVALAMAFGAAVDTVTPGVTLALVMVIVLSIGLYNVVPVVRTGQTLGHRLMGLKVVSAEDGELLDRPRAIRRYAIPVVLVGMGDPLIMVALLLGLSFLFSQTRLSLLDRLARSRVVIAEN
jgi:uncharacterized RDD family membrane protein YckC